MADGAGRMPVAAEVNAFEGKVGGNQRIVSPWNTQDGAVVSDAGDDVGGCVRTGSGESADVSDERLFGKRHSRDKYKRKSARGFLDARSRLLRLARNDKGQGTAFGAAKKVGYETCAVR